MNKNKHHSEAENELPSQDFKHGQGHEGRQGKEGHYKLDKNALAERRVGKLVTRATFVSFLMWTFVFIAACIAKRAAMCSDQNKWIRCSFKKSIIMLVLASLLGVWGLTIK